MAGMIQVTPKTLRSKADELRSQNKTLRTQIDQFRSQANSLNGMWEGAARSSFHQAFLNDIAQMGTFQKMVMIYVGALGTIYNKYVEAENRNIDLAVTRNYI